MKQRPIALLALLLFLILQILPAGLFCEPLKLQKKCEVQVTGRVIRQNNDDEKQQIYLGDCMVRSGESVFETKKLLVYLNGTGEYPIGADLSLSGTIYPLEEPTNPGQFNSRLYYQGQGISYTVYGENAEIAAVHPAFVRRSLQRFRERISRIYDAVLNDLDSGILKAMILGEKTDLNEEIKALYQRNGISHLLAISGLHVSLAGMGLYRLLKRCTGSWFLSGVPALTFLCAYGWMTGASMSTLRAVMMCSLAIAADLVGRTYDMLSAMGAAAMALMITNPLNARQSAFLLSFGAVLGIALVLAIWKLYQNSENKLLQAVSVSLSVMLITFPVLLMSFFEYPLYSTFLNLLVIPLMSVLMVCGILCGLTGMLSLSLAGICGIPCHLILSVYAWSGRKCLTLPGAVLAMGAPERWKIALYYGALISCLFLLYRERRKKKYWHKKQSFHPSVRVLTISLGVMALSAGLLCLRVQTGLSVTMLDVGQGDSIFLKAPDGTACLYDGGSTSVSKVGSYRILPFLKSEGVHELDYILISHMDRDHISGIQELLEDSRSAGGIRIGHAVLPKLQRKDDAYLEMEEMIQKAGISILYMSAGDRLCKNAFSFNCLWPRTDVLSDDRNDLSLVLLAEYGDFQMLLTGDIGPQTERALAASGHLEEAEILKVPHHGSRYSSTDVFLSRVRPDISLISCSAANRYGHPGGETLERLTEAGSRILITRDCGAIRIWTDGKQVRVRCFMDIDN